MGEIMQLVWLNYNTESYFLRQNTNLSQGSYLCEKSFFFFLFFFNENVGEEFQLLEVGLYNFLIEIAKFQS